MFGWLAGLVLCSGLAGWVACWLGGWPACWLGWVGYCTSSGILCMRIYAISFPRVGVLYAYLRYILSPGWCFVCVFTLYPFTGLVFCMRIYAISFPRVGVLYAYLRYKIGRAHV